MTSIVWFQLAGLHFMRADGRGGWALLGNAEGTWGPGGSEWMTKFGLKGHTNIHLLPAIKQATQWWRYQASGFVRWHQTQLYKKKKTPIFHKVCSGQRWFRMQLLVFLPNWNICECGSVEFGAYKHAPGLSLYVLARALCLLLVAVVQREDC